MQSPSPFSAKLDTNYAATPGEIPEIEQWIRDHRAIVNELDDELMEMERQRKEVEKKKQDHLELIKKHSSLTSATRRLPADILSTIFSDVLLLAGPEASTYPPVTASHVCREWRDIALYTPLLWTNILVTIPVYPVPIAIGTQLPMLFSQLSEEDQQRHAALASEWKKRALAMLEQAETFITRSAQCPLNAIVRAADAEYGPGIWEHMVVNDPFYGEELLNRIAAIFNAQERWYSFRARLRVNKVATFLVIFIKLPEILQGRLLSVEYDVEYHGDEDLLSLAWDSGLELNVVLSSGNLTALTLRMPCVDMRRVHARWTALTDLTVGYKSPVSEGEIFTLLRRTPNLERLNIEWSGLTPLGRFEETPLCLERLRHLKISGGSIPIRFSGTFVLPSLTELELRDLQFRDQGREYDNPLVDWVRRYGDQLTHISFEYTTLSSSTLAWVLQHLPNVVSLYLLKKRLPATGTEFIPLMFGHASLPQTTQIDKSLLEKLTPKQSVNAAGCFCPRLERLVCSFAEGQGQDIEDGVINLIQERREGSRRGGHPISWLKEAHMAFDVGPVEPIMEELQRRGVDTNDVKLSARYCDEHSKPPRRTLEIDGVGTIVLHETSSSGSGAFSMSFPGL